MSWKVLDTSEYGGLPHHRKRIFILGVLNRFKKRDFRWPDVIPMKPLEDFLDANAPPNQKPLTGTALQHVRSALQQVVDKGDNPQQVHYVVDIGGSNCSNHSSFLHSIIPAVSAGSLKRGCTATQLH